ncbi:pyrroline-5-carboxylate reductase family protein [Sphingobium sp. CCH11-B1]|jgi:pyrroline-5-carboxylate reductase|uniref:pyrroline-5-carboxylate reductase family protein n=1 Tax=Sphingobium sp. CCH11-B1 TaxID=1768781 RepID=UPI0008366C5D|nr:pyrroline-5-carboxylate reductase dimerization domain-containing protein [Sphingobium sp. CCH11-B1]MEA3390744.1 pyrroline-5-carboxylate reductase dimerization domain-containing protein [Pseudomonadota bacterium]
MRAPDDAGTFPDRLFMVGCGNMAGQMLSRWLTCGLDPARVTVMRPSGRPVADGVAVVRHYPDALPAGTTVLLGMKPYQIDDVAAALAPRCAPDLRLVSILAGTTLAKLRAGFPNVRAIVRAMPNLPVGLGEGVTALFTDDDTDAAAKGSISALIQPLGLAEWIDDEALFNRITALSGCGPAFLFRFIDALARAGEAIGIPADQAARMALATVQGSANMAARAAVSPAALADQVASPGGMTREGLNVLDADQRLLTLLADTLAAARDRGEAMARGA